MLGIILEVKPEAIKKWIINRENRCFIVKESWGYYNELTRKKGDGR